MDVKFSSIGLSRNELFTAAFYDKALLIYGLRNNYCLPAFFTSFNGQKILLPQWVVFLDTKV